MDLTGFLNDPSPAGLNGSPIGLFSQVSVCSNSSLAPVRSGPRLGVTGTPRSGTTPPATTPFATVGANPMSPRPLPTPAGLPINTRALPAPSGAKPVGGFSYLPGTQTNQVPGTGTFPTPSPGRVPAGFSTNTRGGFSYLPPDPNSATPFANTTIPTPTSPFGTTNPSNLHANPNSLTPFANTPPGGLGTNVVPTFSTTINHVTGQPLNQSGSSNPTYGSSPNLGAPVPGVPNRGSSSCTFMSISALK